MADSTLDKASAGAQKLGDAARKAATPIERMNTVFEQLSQTGNTFGNDMVKMQIAATEARMPLEKFAELIQSNNEIMGTLGSSVNKGTQVFADLAKVYHSSGLTENLRQMGYTTGELNEVLALTVGFQKSTYENTKEGQARAAASAAEFAMELDQLTQLTGVSRKEQAENIKKAQADAKLEAKFRQIGLERGETAEADARAAFKSNYAQMSAKGMGDMYKEMFATGTTMSKSASTQLAMYGQAGMAAAKSAQELGKGNTELAAVYTERAGIETMKLQRDKALLDTAIYATGEAGDAARNLIKANDTAYHGLRKSAQETGTAAGDVETAMKRQIEAIKAEQGARAGITQSIRTMGIVMDDVAAAASRRILGELNKKDGGVDRAGKAFSESLLQTGPQTNLKEYAEAHARARQKEEADAKIGKFTPADRRALASGIIGLLADPITGAISAGFNLGLNSFREGFLAALPKAFQEIKQIEVGKMTVGDFKTGTGRAGGTLGETGSAIETKDVMALLHKGETVLTPEQQKNLMTNIRTEAIGDVINKLSSSPNKVDNNKFPGLDVQKLAKTIATTSSKVEVTNWPKSFGQSAAPTKVEVKTEPKKEEKKPDPRQDLAKQVPTQASVRAVDNKIDEAAKATQSQVRAVDNQINEMPSLVNLFIKDQEDELEKAAEQFEGVFKEMIPIKEMESQQSEFKSKFTEDQKKFIEDYQGMSKDNQEFMTFALKRQQDIDAELIEKHSNIVTDLQKKKNERELTEEEEARLADSEMISSRIKEEFAQRQQQLDMIKNIETLADDLELERLDQQARKELELMKGSDAEKLKQSELTNDLMTQQFLEANQEMIGSVGGLNDAAIEARENFMREINEMFDMPEKDEFVEDEYGEGGEAINDAVQNLVDQISGLKEFEEDEYGEGGETIGPAMDNAFTEDEYGEGGQAVNQAAQDLIDQISGLKEFEEDEYGEGGEAIGGELDSSFAEDEYGEGGQAVNQAAQNLADQISGLKEFEEDEYGEGGEAIGGGMDTSFAEDEYGEGGEAIGVSKQSTLTNNFVDFGESKTKANQGQADVAPISMGDFTLGPDGLPIAKPKSLAKGIPSKEDQSDAETKRLQRQNDAKKEDKAKKDSKKDDKKSATTETKTQTKTLDDVVKSLESLNTSVMKLTQKVEETSKQSISAMKSMDGNLFKR